MKRSTLLLTVLTVLLYLGGTAVFAQHGGGHGGGAAGGPGMGHDSASMGHGTHSSTMSGPMKSSGSETSSMMALNKVVNNPDGKLAQKLTSLLPQGMDLKTASGGFTNLGRFVSALHVYNNLGIANSDACKNLTPPATCWGNFASAVQGKSLGAAIKQFDPTVNSKSETRKGQKQANQDIKESGS